MTVDRSLAQEHYAEHTEKPFFGELVDFITSGPTLALVVEGEGAIKVVRTTMGATNPAEAALGTVRGDFALSMPDNSSTARTPWSRPSARSGLWFPDVDP